MPRLDTNGGVCAPPPDGVGYAVTYDDAAAHSYWRPSAAAVRLPISPSCGPTGDPATFTSLAKSLKLQSSALAGGSGWSANAASRVSKARNGDTSGITLPRVVLTSWLATK